MKSWTPYLWKELRENQGLGLVALGVFLGLTFVPERVASDKPWYNRYALTAFAVMQFGGPLLAVLAGIYAMGREQGSIERFWRSRPINSNRWLVAKYLTGLALVWLACWAPLVICILGRGKDRSYFYLLDIRNMALAYSLILLLIYSVSFVLGECIRSLLHAGILAIGAMAMIFLMPLIIAPLNWLSVEVLHAIESHTLSVRSAVVFAMGMVAISAVLLWLAGIMLKRDVHIEVNRRMLSWLLVVLALVLVAGMVFPMGTNMPAKQIIPLPISHRSEVHDIAADGNDVLVLLSTGPQLGSSGGRKYGLVRVHVGERTSTVSEPVWFITDPGQPRNRNETYPSLHLAWSPEHPSLAYVTVARGRLQDWRMTDQRHTLYTIALDAGSSDPVVHRTELDPSLGTQISRLTPYVYEDRLYLYSLESGNVRLLTFSLADPGAPSLVQNDVIKPIGVFSRGHLGQYQMRLIPIEDAGESARIEITYKLAASYWTPVGDGRVLTFEHNPNGIVTELLLFGPDPAQDSVVPLHPIASYRGMALERLMRVGYGNMFHSDDVAYWLRGNGVAVYQIHESNRIVRVGHYAAEGGFSTVVTLPHNRVVLAGKRLHVLDLSDRLSR